MLISDPGTSDISPDLVGILGGYELTIYPDGSPPQLVSRGTQAIGDSVLVNGIKFFTSMPCTDCLLVNGVSYSNGNIVLNFKIRHPFPKGDLSKPPSAKNRLDLDLFDLAMVVVPHDKTPIHYALANQDLYYGIIANPDGYTTELGNIISNPAAMPYILVVDDSEATPPANTFNKFEMGMVKEFQVGFPMSSGESLSFDLYLTFGYGTSATFQYRLLPSYYNPEFNRKSAWKVEVIPPNGTNLPIEGNTWDDIDASTQYNVTVQVYDWQIGADVNPNLNKPSDIREISDVDYVGVVIPGMNSSPPFVSGDSYIPGGTGKPGNPLVYKIPVKNENLLTNGEYIGLVKVADTRKPNPPSEGNDYLIDSPNGIALNEYLMPEFATYQTFIASVVHKMNYNYICENSVQTHEKATVSGIVTRNHPDSYYFYMSPNGFTSSSTITIEISSGQIDVYIFGQEPDETCPGKVIGRSLNISSNHIIDMTADKSSKIYIAIYSDSINASYTMHINFKPQLTQIMCEVYVATDDGTPTGHWPVYEVPDPDVELTIDVIWNMINWHNIFWDQYGYKIIWDGTVEFMDSEYYNCEDACGMHCKYGMGTNKLSLYFIDNGGAFVIFSMPIWAQNVNSTCTVYGMEGGYDNGYAVAHELGHSYGYLGDEYIFQVNGCDCGDCVCANCVGHDLYLDEYSCYHGNLMWFGEGNDWNHYNLSSGQIQWVYKFHFDYPGSFPWF